MSVHAFILFLTDEKKVGGVWRENGGRGNGNSIQIIFV